MINPDQKLALRTLIITTIVLATTLLTGFILYFAYVVRAVILDLVIALVIAAALRPLVALFRKRRLGKITASLLSIFLTLIILGGIGSLIATPLFNEATKLISNSPEIINSITQNSQLSALNSRFHFVNTIAHFRDQILTGASGNAIPIVTGIIGGITSAMAIIIFVFFMLVDGPETWTRLLGYLPEGYRNRINTTGQNMMTAISGFVSGNLFISLIAGTFSLLILLLFKVPYPFALAALVALLDLIPLVGTTIATIIISLITLTKGFVITLVIASILIAYQFIENHFIQPVVYSRSVKLSALFVIIATLVGAELAGIVGVILAIPTAAVIQIAIIDIFFSTPKRDH